MSRYIDLSYSFELTADGDLPLVYDNDALYQSIVTILETPTGLRPGVGNDDFGCNVRRYIFGELSEGTADSIREEIFEQLGKYEPRIIVDKVDIEIDIDAKAYYIKIYYHAINDSATRTYNFVLNVR